MLHSVTFLKFELCPTRKPSKFLCRRHIKLKFRFFLEKVSITRFCFPFFCLFRPPHNKSTPATLMSVLIVGLLSLSGLIMFISIFKSEVYHKLQTDLSGKESLFTFNYGQSFILYVIGFVVVELSGILNVCLFNKLQQIAQDNQVKSQVISVFRFLKSITLNHRIEVTTNLIFRSFPFSLAPTSCLSLSL